MFDDECHHFFRRIVVVEQLMDVNRRMGVIMDGARQRTSGYEVHVDGVGDIGKRTGVNVVKQRPHREWHERKIWLATRLCLGQLAS